MSDHDTPVSATDADTGQTIESPDLPEDPAEARDVLIGLLADARTREAAEADQALRALAELDNVRKRALRDRAQTIELATERLVTQLLPVIDSFDAALTPGSDEPAVLAVIEGVAALRDQFLTVLAGEGLSRIATDGPFDPTVHEAVSVLGEGDPLVVVHEMRSGWMLGSKVLRPATVVVGPEPVEGDT